MSGGYVSEIEVPAVFGTEAEQSAQRSGEQQADGKRKSAVETWERGEVGAGVGIVGRRCAREGQLFRGLARLIFARTGTWSFRKGLCSWRSQYGQFG